MKYIFTLAFIFLSLVGFGQVPEGIAYQAIAYNTNGSPVINTTIGIKISISNNSANGTVVYSENHMVQTNNKGLFNLNIGSGSSTQGLFSSINWAEKSKYLKVEIDPAGGTNYTITGTNQLMSVPYALYSETTNERNLTNLSSRNGDLVVVYTSSNAYAFTKSTSGNPSWYSTTLSGTVQGAIATDSAVVVYTTSNAYAATRSQSGNPTWYSTTMSGSNPSATSSRSGVVVYTSTNAYAFMRSASGNPSWYANTLSGSPLGATVSANEAIVVYTTSNAYGMMRSGSGLPNWRSTTLSGTVLGATAAGNNIVVYTSSNAYGFTRSSSGNPTWFSTTLSGTPMGISPK